MREQQTIPQASDDNTTTTEQLPRYEKPRVTVMDEADVLKAFQFTSAGISWWVM